MFSSDDKLVSKPIDVASEIMDDSSSSQNMSNNSSMISNSSSMLDISMDDVYSSVDHEFNTIDGYKQRHKDSHTNPNFEADDENRVPNIILEKEKINDEKNESGEVQKKKLLKNNERKLLFVATTLILNELYDMVHNM